MSGSNVSLSHQLIERANRNGFEALIVTVDSPVSPNREYNTHNGFGLPFMPTVRFTLDIMRHPAWITGVLMKYFTAKWLSASRELPGGIPELDPERCRLARCVAG